MNHKHQTQEEKPPQSWWFILWGSWRISHIHRWALASRSCKRWGQADTLFLFILFMAFWLFLLSLLLLLFLHQDPHNNFYLKEKKLKKTKMLFYCDTKTHLQPFIFITDTHTHAGGRWLSPVCVCVMMMPLQTQSGPPKSIRRELTAADRSKAKTRRCLSSWDSWASSPQSADSFVYTNTCSEIPSRMSNMFVKDLALRGSLSFRGSPPGSGRDYTSLHVTGDETENFHLCWDVFWLVEVKDGKEQLRGPYSPEWRPSSPTLVSLKYIMFTLESQVSSGPSQWGSTVPGC